MQRRLIAILQKTVISVDERGTEAAAGTAVVMAEGARPPKLRRVAFDKPSLFAPLDRRRGLVLMTGHVDNPAGKQTVAILAGPHADSAAARGADVRIAGLSELPAALALL